MFLDQKTLLLVATSFRKWQITQDGQMNPWVLFFKTDEGFWVAPPWKVRSGSSYWTQVHSFLLLAFQQDLAEGEKKKEKKSKEKSDKNKDRNSRNTGMIVIYLL